MHVRSGSAGIQPRPLVCFLYIVLGLACGPAPPDEEPATTSGDAGSGAPPTTDAVPTSGTGGGSTTSAITAMTSTTSGPVIDTTSGTGEDSTCGFICDDSVGESCGANIDGLGDGLEWRCTICDVFKQDCPDGSKCAAKTSIGDTSWDTTICAPVTGDGAPGEACIAEDGFSGVDDCRKGAMCWDVDEETHEGICVELCTGTAASPMCSNEAELDCATVNDSVLNVCLPACDPLLQACADDGVCVPAGSTFICMFDASNAQGQAFDPCKLANACDVGLACVDSMAGAECDPNAAGCCLPFCDLSDPDAACPGAGQSCVSWYAGDALPPGFVNVGVCAVPA